MAKIKGKITANDAATPKLIKVGKRLADFAAREAEREKKINDGMMNSADPADREAYRIVAEMGISWYHLESVARQVARCAAADLILANAKIEELKKTLADIDQPGDDA